jgi:hypothetical protein
MSSLFRVYFEVVKEGRILGKIKQLQNLIGGVFCLAPVWYQDLNENDLQFNDSLLDKNL